MGGVGKSVVYRCRSVDGQMDGEGLIFRELLPLYLGENDRDVVGRVTDREFYEKLNYVLTLNFSIELRFQIKKKTKW